MLKKSCPECGSIVELDESKYEPGTSVSSPCQLCGTEIEFEIPEHVSVSEEKNEIIAEPESPIVKIPGENIEQEPEVMPSLIEPSSHHDNNESENATDAEINDYISTVNSSNTALKSIIGLLAFVAIIFITYNLAIKPSSAETAADQIDTATVVEEVAAVADDRYLDYGGDYHPGENSSIKVTSACTYRKMAVNSNGYMLIPDFLSLDEHLENGGYTYRAGNDAYLLTMSGYSDVSAETFVNGSCKSFNQTYKRAKDNWAVNSGTHDNMYYYAKAVKIEDVVYFAYFEVPKGEKENAKTYQELTETIFSRDNFPHFMEKASRNSLTLDELSEAVCTRILTYSDIEGLSKDELRILRNTIFARHGRKFKDEELRNYFNSKSWYNGIYDDIPNNSLSSTEQRNLILITSFE